MHQVACWDDLRLSEAVDEIIKEVENVENCDDTCAICHEDTDDPSGLLVINMKRWWLKTRFCMFSYVFLACPRNRSPCFGKWWVLHDSFSWKNGRLNSKRALPPRWGCFDTILSRDVSLPFNHVRKLGYRCVFSSCNDRNVFFGVF